MIEALLACPACAQGPAQTSSPWAVAAMMVVPFVVALAIGLYLRKP